MVSGHWIGGCPDAWINGWIDELIDILERNEYLQ